MKTLIPKLEEVRTITLKLEQIGFDSELERQKNIKPKAIGGLEAIKESIKNIGMNEPLVVYEDFDSYNLCDGYNRLRAIKDLELSGMLPENLDVNNLKCIVIPKEDRNVVRYMTDIRQDLPPSLKAQYIKKLFEEHGMKRTDIAHMCGYSVNTIRNWLNVSRLIEEIRELMDKEKLPVDCAVSISPLSEAGQRKLLSKIENWETTITRDEVRGLVSGFPSKYFIKTKSEREELGDKLKKSSSQRKFLSKSLSTLSIEKSMLDNELQAIRRENRRLVAWIQKILRNDDVKEYLLENYRDVLEELNQIVELEMGKI